MRGGRLRLLIETKAAPPLEAIVRKHGGAWELDDMTLADVAFYRPEPAAKATS
jgi:hypothetical protein